MRLLQDIADYTLGQAYIVIKAISKKDKKLMAENEVRFKEGCLKKGLTREQADQLWELILPFAGYSFNRPHSTLYGLLSYQTAWLKVNYPVEYMAAVLKGAGGVTEDIAKAVNECRQRGVTVLGPDVNSSAFDFAIREYQDPADGQVRRGILFGLAAIKNVGAGPLEALLRERDAGGPFRSLENLCDRVDRHALNKRVLESLIRCGALDSLPGSRRQKLAILDLAMEAGARAQKNRETGQIDMFGGITEDTTDTVSAIPLPAIVETPEDRKEQLAWEKELLGVIFSSDPRKAALERATIPDRVPLAAIRDAESLQEYQGSVLTFAGLLARVRAVSTKKGDTMLVAALEDEHEEVIELVAFPRVYEKYRDLLRQDALLIVKARVDERNGGMQLVLESAAQLDLSAAAPPPVTPEMDLDALADDERVISAPPSGPAPEVPAPARPAPPPPPITAPVALIKPRAASRSQSPPSQNGNGHDGRMPQVPGEPPPGRTMRLRFPRSADQEADIRLMQHVYDLLRGRDGSDQVVIQVDVPERRVLLRMRQTITCDEGLLGALRGALGNECVTFE